MPAVVKPRTAQQIDGRAAPVYLWRRPRKEPAMPGPIRLALPPLLLLAAGPALAHTGEGVAGGLISGFTHPLFGWDHVVAMVAVGLWGAFLGKPAIWILPIVFPLVMAFGAALGVAGVPVPQVETGIALSGVVLGLLVALAVKAPLWVAAVIVGVFAIFHGHAHGTELPEAANPFAYAVGFVVGTGLLHAIGIALGFLTAVPKGQYIIRAAGVAIAAVGAAFLAGIA
jgi:urease accessory protein